MANASRAMSSQAILLLSKGRLYPGFERLRFLRVLMLSINLAVFAKIALLSEVGLSFVQYE
jgi:hypothetical protein